MRKIIVQYFQSAFYSILKNRLYALFCIAGVALTFIFVTLVLQLMHIYTGNYPPLTYSDRIIRLPEFYQDTEGHSGSIAPSEVNVFMDELKEFNSISLLHTEGANLTVNEQLNFSNVGFVNADFWNIYTFDFLYGKPFSKEDCTNKKKLAVVSEDISLSYFNTRNGIGKKIFFQDIEYEVGGVVKSFSTLSSPSSECGVWFPYVFNKFSPSGRQVYTIDILVPSEASMDLSKERISGVIQHYFAEKNAKVDFPPQKIHTLSEKAGNNNFFAYGTITVLVLLLIIPALNILSLSVVNTGNRAEEIAIRRIFGASSLSSFFQIMVENTMLVATGALIGLPLATPTLHWIQQTVTSDSMLEDISLIAHIDYMVILVGVLPAMFIFTLLSGGLPAYLISKKSVIQILKGGEKE